MPTLLILLLAISASAATYGPSSERVTVTNEDVSVAERTYGSPVYAGGAHAEYRTTSVPRINIAYSESVLPPSTNEVGDIAYLTQTNSAIPSYGLTAVSRNIDGSETDLDGSWSILDGAAYATLDGATLRSTSRTGPVTIGFTSADGSVDISRSVSMYYTMTGRVTNATLEVADSWRRAQFDALATLFRTVDPDGPVSVYRHGRGGQPNTYHTNLVALQLYATNEVRNPRVCNGAFFSRAVADLLRCQSVGRTDFCTDTDTRPAMFVTPHYAVCAKHYTPETAVFCIDRDTPAFIDVTFGTVNSREDLQLLHSDTAYTGPLPAFVSLDTVQTVSSSCLTNGLAMYVTQHGTVHPCVAQPIVGSGWSQSVPGAGANRTYADLSDLQHYTFAGDSGHAVCMMLGSRLVPVGLLHYASGSATPLMDFDVIDWLNGAIRNHSDGVESLTILTADDLSGE